MKILRDHSLGLSNAEIEHLCEIADKNHDGYISLEEFIGESERRKREFDEHLHWFPGQGQGE